MISKTKVLSYLLFCLSLTAFSQNNYDSSNKKAIKSYERALENMQARDEITAAKHAIDAITEDPNFTDAHSLLGFIYEDKKQFEKALFHYNKAIEINPNFDVRNYLQVGLVAFKVEKYESSAKNLTTFLKDPSIHPKAKAKAEHYLANALFAKEAIKNPVPFNPQNLGPGVNSKFNEYFPTITADNQILLYTRMLKSGYSSSGYQEDFFLSTNVADEWSGSRSLGYPINTVVNEGAPSISADGKTIFFTVCETFGEYGENRDGFGSCDLFMSRIEGNKWVKPINLGNKINSAHWESQPCFSSDGKTLFFVKRVKKNGKTEQDIFVTTMDRKGQFTDPIRLSDTINTPGREESVFIHPDNKTLYFSSNGHPGFGSLDIFMSKKLPNGRWGKPINLGYPINTSRDENSLLVNAAGNLAYFASDRKEGMGGFDIYAFELDQKLRPTPVTYAKGIVFDKTSKRPLGAKFELIDLETNEIIVSSNSDRIDGSFLVSLPTGNDYALNVSRKGYLFHSENFSLPSTDNGEAFVLEVPMSPIEVNNSVVLKNVFFETAKFDLKLSSEVELKKLTLFLLNNPTISIEISGHTDNVGSESDNQVLSLNRAKEVKAYLVNKGINADRLVAKGYGDSMPLSSNDTKEGKAKNRRTEFKVIKK